MARVGKASRASSSPLTNEHAMWWKFVHNVIAHPLLFFANDAGWSVRFHDWSRHKMHRKYQKLYERIY